MGKKRMQKCRYWEKWRQGLGAVLMAVMVCGVLPPVQAAGTADPKVFNNEKEDSARLSETESERDTSEDREETEDFVIVDNTIREYRGAEKTVVIPDGITRIGYEAFLDHKEIESIVIPKSVTKIRSEERRVGKEC